MAQAHRAKLLCLIVVVFGLLAVDPASGAGHAVVRRSLATRVLVRLNQIRGQHGLVPLVRNSRLDVAARQHSSEMVADGYFAHDSFDGAPFWQRLRRVYGNWTVGENLLWSEPDIGAARALALWMASPEHRSAILDPRWRDIGVGAVHAAAAPGTFRGRAVTVITTDFGVRR